MDIIWIGIAFLFGFFAHLLRLPPLVGYLFAGFALHALGIDLSPTVDHFADIGVTLLLFTIGLKLRPSTLLRPQVWAVASIHMVLSTLLFSAGLMLLVMTGLQLFTDLTVLQALLIGFALSFSSTIFAVKVFEDKGEMGSLHGRLSIGILIMQDLAAVAFLAVSAGKTPSMLAIMLLLLVPLRFLLLRLMDYISHGELLVLFGLALALGGAELFELFKVKGDLGALFLGMLAASHPRASELSRQLLNLKDLFLVGFFLGIGLTSKLDINMVLVAALLSVVVVFKLVLFFRLLTWMRMRSRTALLTSLSLANYSEFGLIVASIGVGYGYIPPFWLGAIAVAVSIMFVIGAPLNRIGDSLYRRHRARLKRYESASRLLEEGRITTGDAQIVIFGMGRVGSGAYDALVKGGQGKVLGIDYDKRTVDEHVAAGRNVMLGSATDPDFWSRVDTSDHRVSLVMLAMPNFSENLHAAMEIDSLNLDVQVVATVKYADDAERLRKAGVDAVFNLYEEAGAGFAALASEAWQKPRTAD
jgi:predicted Kef-type K+ transport protein